MTPSAKKRRGRRLGKAVRVAGQELYLTPTEYRLLEVLRSEPGRVFTRDELLNRVMPDSVVLARTIDVHVKSLRHKLGAARDCIGTVQNVGYRFVPP